MPIRNASDNLLNETERDPWFNPYRLPASEQAWALVHGLRRDFESREHRRRARAKKDQRWLWEALPALITDLCHHFLSGSPGAGLVVPRAKAELGKKSRYHPPIFTRSFPKLLDELEKQEYLEQEIGVFSPGKWKRTTIRAGAPLISSIKKRAIDFDDLTVANSEEVIILKRPKYDFADDGERIEYDDTAATMRLRAEVQSLNSWFESADIAFDATAYSLPVDVRARRLYRYFANGDFKSGGRLFKGFWQNLSKPARLRGITIEGESVVELDYGQLNPTLAYANVGVLPPAGDAYTLPGLEQNRDGVKKVFNALLFDKGPRTKFPVDVSAKFPPKTKVSEVIGSIYRKHPSLAPVFSREIGFRLMYLESEIMMRVLERLRDKDIVGLPVFDAVIVKASRVEEARAVMLEQFKKATGQEIRVHLERP